MGPLGLARLELWFGLVLRAGVELSFELVLGLARVELRGLMVEVEVGVGVGVGSGGLGLPLGVGLELGYLLYLDCL